MTTYGYEAVDREGKDAKGSIEANSIEEAKDELKNQGLLIVKIEEQNFLSKDININIGGYPTARDLSVFCRQFVSMARAGVTLLEALKMLSEQTENKRLQEALTEVRVSVEKGDSLAGSMKEHPKIFPAIMVNMVAAGEASGSLDVAFDRVAIQLERSSKTQSLVKKAMIYPIVVLCVSAVVIVVMLVFVIPKYAEMFDTLDTELPGITLAVMAVSNFIRRNWFIIIPVIVGIVFLLKAFGKTDAGKHVYGKLALKLPLIKNLVVKQASSQMARTLSTLLGSGVSMVEAVDIVSEVMNNVWYKEAMKEVKNQVMLGVPISQPVEKCGLFPPMVYHMIKIGEESGNVEDMLDKLADYYDEEVELSVQSIMAAMEPMIIVLLAIIVGTLIASVMAPMVKMYQTLDTL